MVFIKHMLLTIFNHLHRTDTLIKKIFSRVEFKGTHPKNLGMILNAVSVKSPETTKRSKLPVASLDLVVHSAPICWLCEYTHFVTKQTGIFHPFSK